jgi:hypothetical protein
MPWHIRQTWEILIFGVSAHPPKENLEPRRAGYLGIATGWKESEAGLMAIMLCRRGVRQFVIPHQSG